MSDGSSLTVDRIFFGVGFVIAVLVVVRPFAVFRFLGDGLFGQKVDPRGVRVVQLMAVLVAVGTATRLIRSFLH